MNKFFLHPLLFALYPLLFLYARNIHEYTEESLLVPFVISFLFGVIVFLLSKVIFKHWDVSAIIASTVIIISLSFASLLSLFPYISFSISTISITQETIGIITSILFIGIVTVITLRYKKYLLGMNKILTLLAIFLVGFSLFDIVLFELKSGRLWAKKTVVQSLPVQQNSTSQNYPDIYYFIFDRYAGPRSLSEEYEFDNSNFFNFLKSKGFYVAEESTTNYPKTFLSLGSSLNMEYLDYLTEKTDGGESKDESILTPFIRNSKVLQFLKEKGYYTVNIGPKSWNATSNNTFANKNYILQKGTYPYVDAFGTGYLNTTIASPLFKQIFHDPMDVSIDPYNNEHRKLIVYQLEAINDAISIPGPKFVFVHVLLPHDPFVFDKDCNPISEKVVEGRDHLENYFNQLQCANSKIMPMIDTVLTKSKKKPIIILQSDEGPFPIKNPLPPKQSWATTEDESLREKFPILNAYYFPEATPSALYQSITPVNSFRVLFNEVFNTNYELLPDKNYIFQDEENLYKFTEVTDKLK